MILEKKKNACSLPLKNIQQKLQCWEIWVLQCFSLYLSSDLPTVLSSCLLPSSSGFLSFQQGWCGTIQSQGGRDTYILVTISSRAYLIRIKPLVTVCILKCSACLVAEVRSHCERRKQKTIWGNRLAVSPHAYHSITLSQICDLMASVSQNLVLQRV